MDQSYDKPLARLHSGDITYLQFLAEAKCDEKFQKWCKEHYLKADEGAAQLFFDYLGFEDTAMVKEFIEPVVN